MQKYLNIEFLRNFVDHEILTYSTHIYIHNFTHFSRVFRLEIVPKFVDF